MNKKTIILSLFALLWVGTHSASAQAVGCQFIFKGTLAGKSITMCFMPDENDGQVNGEYYYGSGEKGVLYFRGTALRQGNGSFKQRLEERNEDGVVTGYFTGTLNKGVMTGTWTSSDGKRSFPYQLKLQ